VSSQCAEAAKKAMKVLAIIRRQFKDLDKEPHLEFAIQAWSPYFKRDIECLEKVQRQATKVVKGFKSLSYEARLHKLGLTTLYDRRLRGDFIEAYKIITIKENVKKEVFFEFSDTGYNLRGDCYKLATKRSQICKVFGAVVRDELVKFLDKYKLIRDSQHGFRKGRPCVTNLLLFLDQNLRCVDEGFCVDC